MTTYELPPEPPIGSRVTDREGRTWTRNNMEWEGYAAGSCNWRFLMQLAPLTLIEPDPWPTAPLIVADRGGRVHRRGMFVKYKRDADYLDLAAAVDIETSDVLWAEDGDDTLTNVVPVTVVPVAALPVLWSALEQWINHANRILPSEETQLLVGAVVALREQIDALGVDL